MGISERFDQANYWTTVLYDALLGRGSRSYYVLGYVRSGTNWLCSLTGDTLGLPVYEPWKEKRPALSPRVFHMHRFLPFRSVRERTIYIMRDGRDTVVSRYFHSLKRDAGWGVEARKHLGFELTADNIRESLPAFIEFLASYNRACADYRTHLSLWLGQNYPTVRYEDLLADTEGALTRGLTGLLGRSPDAKRVRDAVEKHDFARKARRKPGTEDRSAYLRKGISSDWKNYFTPAAARAFDDYAGDILIRLGYEKDHSWVHQVQP